jgi:hypothetical protein
MQFLVQLCRSIERPNITGSSLKGELNSYMEPILTALNDKLGDNIVKTRQLAEESLMGMAEHQSFGVNICINSFLKASSTSSSKEGATKKAMQSTKHLVGR